jgi:hypothetical protein
MLCAVISLLRCDLAWLPGHCGVKMWRRVDVAVSKGRSGPNWVKQPGVVVC